MIGSQTGSDPYVLVAEDDEDDRALIERVVGRAGLAEHVHVVSDGVEAMEHLAGRRLPAAMILDIKMQNMGGLEVLEKVREDCRTRHLPVVILTSSDEERDMREAMRLSANSYVRKPTEFSQYQSTFQSIVHYWLFINERAG